ncbi:MAG TPA: anhydro-N-acetylmuramic acid kinase [Herpetosiphonaceae bacterium]
MLVIGLISGTSIDAIDAALVEIERHDETLQVAVRAFTMQPFDEALRERVRGLLPPNTGSTAEVCEVNVLLGQAFAEAARAVAQDAGVALAAVDLIASHGQTVYHQVAPGSVRSTLQLGAPAVIAEQTGCTVAADFRTRDMAVGGEGAPLVPYLDQLLFTDNQSYRALQNIGGIGNVTLLSPNGAELAFDTGPGNVLIDEAVRLLTDGAQTFDRDGQLAAAGQVDQVLLAEWLRHPFFDQRPPKSTGREQWGPAEARGYVAQAQERGLSTEDMIATITALTAHSIARAYQRFLSRVDEALIGGGGARNPTLMRMLRSALSPVTVRPVDDLALSADAKEAVAFALMGYATLHGWPGNVPAATGAAQPVVLGSITPGLRYRSLIAQVLSTPDSPPARAKLIDPADL